MLEDPHLHDVGFFREIDHPSEGRVRTTRPANSFSGGMPAGHRPAPRLGEHTAEVLAELGFGAAEIERMAAAGAVRQAAPAGDDQLA